jgi:2-polyprenyl-3-methyl-5-hydroxy-6-metoxy-1,4-benzoquinol methylase
VIEHLIMPDRVLEEFTRVLRHGGHILLTVPNVAFWRFRVQALSGQVPSVTADSRHLHSFSASLLAQLIRKLVYRSCSLQACANDSIDLVSSTLHCSVIRC